MYVPMFSVFIQNYSLLDNVPPQDMRHETAAEVLNSSSMDNIKTLEPKMNKAAKKCLYLAISHVLVPGSIYILGFGLPLMAKQIILGTNAIIINVIRVPIVYYGLIKSTFRPQSNENIADDYFSHLVPRDDEGMEPSTPNETEV